MRGEVNAVQSSGERVRNLTLEEVTMEQMPRGAAGAGLTTLGM